jgi:hypothetical protein
VPPLLLVKNDEMLKTMKSDQVVDKNLNSNLPGFKALFLFFFHTKWLLSRSLSFFLAAKTKEVHEDGSWIL